MAKNKNIDDLKALAEEYRENGEEEIAERIETSVTGLSDQLTNLTKKQVKEEKKEEKKEDEQREQEDKPEQLSQEEMIEQTATKVVEKIERNRDIAGLAVDMGIDPFVAQTMLDKKPDDYEGGDKEYLESLKLGSSAKPFEGTSEFAVPKTQEEKDALFKEEEIKSADFIKNHKETLDKLSEQEGGEELVNEIMAKHYDAQPDKTDGAKP